MNCDTHNQKIIAICQQCKCSLCLQCILYSHETHLHQIVLFITLKFIIDELNSGNLSDYNFHHQFYKYSNIQYQFLEQKQIYSKILNVFKIRLGFHQQQRLIQFIEKENIKMPIYRLLRQDDANYVYLKQYDLYYLLKHYGNNQKAFEIQRLTLMKLMKDNCFFDIKNDQIQSDKQYNQIEQDEHFIISQGRIYYFMQKYSECIEFMNNYQQIEEARIYIALSNLCLHNFEQANQYLEEFKLKPKYIDMIKLFQLEIQDKRNETLECYEMLYQKYQSPLFFNAICQILLLEKKIGKIQEFCDQVIEFDPNNYSALLYKANTLFYQNKITEFQKICFLLTQIEPSNIIGYIFHGVYLISQNKFQEVDDLFSALKMQFQPSNFLLYFECINLLRQEKFKDSLKVLYKIGTNIQQFKFILHILILLQLKNLPLLYDSLFRNLGSNFFDYQWLNYICNKINSMALDDEAINLLQGYVDDAEKEGKNFYHVLLGKLLVDYGIKFKDLDIVQQGLNELTNFVYDESSLPYVFYYRGQALLKLDKFKEATENFENAYKDIEQVYKPVLHEILIAHKFIQGNFQEVVHLLESSKYLQSELSIFIKGLLLWLQGQNSQSIQLLEQLTQEFPLIYFVISWIFGEENKKTEQVEILQKLQQLYPKFTIFCKKHAFISSGPYTSHIINNKSQYDLFDDKKFYAIKTLVVYLECLYVAPQIIFPLAQVGQLLLKIIVAENQMCSKQKRHSIINLYLHI